MGGEVTHMDILGAVYDYLMSELEPAPKDIVRGWQNRASLPPVSDYVVLTLLDAKRIGSNVLTGDDITPVTGIDVTMSMLTHFSVQIDFCGTDEQKIMAMASQCSMTARSVSAVSFLAPYDITPLYTDDVRSLPYIDEQDQWCVRYSVTWHLSAWTRKTTNEDAFEAVTVYLEDVDVHHPIINNED